MDEHDYELAGRLAALRAEWTFDPTSSARPVWGHPAGLALTWIEGSGMTPGVPAPEPVRWLLTVFAYPAGTGMLDRAWLAGASPAVPVTDPDASASDAWRLPDDVLNAVDRWLCSGSVVGYEWRGEMAVLVEPCAHGGHPLGIPRRCERMHQVLRLRISDLIDRGPRTRAEDAGPSAFDGVPPPPVQSEGFDGQPEVLARAMATEQDARHMQWVGRLSVKERAIYENIRADLRPTLHRIVDGRPTPADAYQVLLMVHEARESLLEQIGRAAKPPEPELELEPEPESVTSWWGAVVHRYEATATVTTYGRCSWEITPAGSSLRVEVPALSFPADEPRPGVVARSAWNISAYVAHIPVASVLYYVENTEEWTRDGYANDMDATRGPKWQMFP